MKSTIRTEAGVAAIAADIGRVSFNGASMLPHEAELIGSELMRAAKAAIDKAAAYAREQIEHAKAA